MACASFRRCCAFFRLCSCISGQIQIKETSLCPSFYRLFLTPPYVALCFSFLVFFVDFLLCFLWLNPILFLSFLLSYPCFAFCFLSLLIPASFPLAYIPSFPNYIYGLLCLCGLYFEFFTWVSFSLGLGLGFHHGWG